MEVYRFDEKRKLAEYQNIQTGMRLTAKSFDGFSEKIVQVKIKGPQGGIHGSIHMPLAYLKTMLKDLEVTDGN